MQTNFPAAIFPVIWQHRFLILLPKPTSHNNYYPFVAHPHYTRSLKGLLIVHKENHILPENFNQSILTEADQVFVKDGERCWFVKLSDIRLFESVGNYAKVFFGGNKPLILKSLNALEERLDQKTFFRANRKHIVNLRMIDKIEPYFNGGLLLELKGGEKIEVSRRQTVKFKEMMSL